MPSPTVSDSAQEIVFQNIDPNEDEDLDINESIEDELPSERNNNATNTVVNIGSVVPNPKLVKNT